MSCCGSRRATWRREPSLVARRTPAPAIEPPAAGEAPKLRCTRGAPLYLRGPTSGRAYRFSEEPVPVDAADVQALLRTGRLELA